MNYLETLQSRFGIDGHLCFETGVNDMALAVLTAGEAEAHVYLHGAHVTHYSPAVGKPVLWMSSQSEFEPGRAIRGGVPLVFPWFGPKHDNPAAPSHGFARLLEWEVLSTQVSPEGEVEITFGLESQAASRALWPGDFELRYTVGLGPALRLELEVLNPGVSPLRFEAALHSYFVVSDVREISILGLAGTTYISQVEGNEPRTGAFGPLRLVSETDRIYQDTRETCTIIDARSQRRIAIEKTGSNNTVVWNPWTDKAARLPDFPDDGWPGMVCIETCNVGISGVELQPGQSHLMQATIRIEEIPAPRAV